IAVFFIVLPALTLLLGPLWLPWLPWWVWLLVGGVAEIAIIWTSLSDEATAARVVAEMFRRQFDPQSLRQKPLRERVEKALEYRGRIEEVVRRTQKGVLRDHLAETARQITTWVEQVYLLAQRLDAYASDPVLEQDLRSVPLAIKNFRKRLEDEDDEAVRAQLQETIAGKEAQWANLQRLQNTMERAEYQLENTLAAMGTVYAQLQLMGAKDINSGRAQRLREDIAEQVAALQDVLETMDEVYKGQEYSVGQA
ncbi:MAG: hypothetical protein H5T62_15460, partial [Anaerolineae bacterium]|nr:hypothetical protein [Anaerolineae bacterium]